MRHTDTKTDSWKCVGQFFTIVYQRLITHSKAAWKDITLQVNTLPQLFEPLQKNSLHTNNSLRNHSLCLLNIEAEMGGSIVCQTCSLIPPAIVLDVKHLLARLLCSPSCQKQIISVRCEAENRISQKKRKKKKRVLNWLFLFCFWETKWNEDFNFLYFYEVILDQNDYLTNLRQKWCIKKSAKIFLFKQITRRRKCL